MSNPTLQALDRAQETLLLAQQLLERVPARGLTVGQLTRFDRALQQLTRLRELLRELQDEGTGLWEDEHA